MCRVDTQKKWGSKLCGRLTPTKERSDHLSSTPRKESRSTANVLIYERLVYLGTLDHARSFMLTMWGIVELLGNSVSAQFPEWLETKASHAEICPCLCDQLLIKSLNTKVLVRVLGWQYTWSTVIHYFSQKLILFTWFHSKKATGISGLHLLGLYCMHLFHCWF